MGYVSNNRRYRQIDTKRTIAQELPGLMQKGNYPRVTIAIPYSVELIRNISRDFRVMVE